MVSTSPNGSNVTSTQSRKEPRRRSWFGLVTPKRKERLATVLPTAVEQPEPEPSPDRNDPGRVEELDSGPRRSPADAFGRRQWSSSMTDDEAPEDDSDREGTVRRKSKTARSKPSLLVSDSDQDDQAPVRMKDMATLAILSRNNTDKPQPFPPHIVQRTTTDSSSSSGVLPVPSLAPRPHTLVLAPSRVPQRSSSVGARHTPTKQHHFAQPAPFRSFPSTPPPVDKPLPPPPPDAFADIAAPRAVSLPLPNSTPAPPADIVVTPSSPIDGFDGLFGLTPSSPTFALVLDGAEPLEGADDPRPPSAPPSAPISRTPSTSELTPRPTAAGRARSESPTPMRPDSQALGLGLPEAVAAKRASTSAGHHPSLRPQAVSSPLPERASSPRASSPLVKVTFSAAETSKPSQDKDRKPIKNRPRSLSAMLSRAPAAEFASPTDDEEPAPSGMFGWLGVQRGKTIKRRRSESKLRKRRSGFFSSEKDSGPNENGAEDVSSAKSPIRSRFGQNASTPMLINRSIPDLSRTQPPQHSAGSSLSSLPVIDQVEFWSARDWANKGPSLEIETMSSETTTTETYRSDNKRGSTPIPVPGSSRDSVPRRLLDTNSTRSSMGSTSPLSSLPELGPPPTIAEHEGEPTPPQVTSRPGGRGRSFSDAARRIHSEEGSVMSSQHSFRSPSDLDLPRGPRPPLSTRSSSSNSAVLGMVRSVFSRNRPRSNSTLRYSSADEGGIATSEFGSRELVRPGSSASSLGGPSPALPPVRIRPEDVPQVSSLALQIGEDDRRVILNETPDRSPRSSYAASQSSRTTHSTRRSATTDPNTLGIHSGLRGGRARAQTTSSALSWHGTFNTLNSTAASHGHGGSLLHRGSQETSLAPPSAFGGSTTYLPSPSTPTFPTASTPPRQRPSSIRRLSTGLFRSNPNSPKPPHGQLFPLPARGAGAGSSGGPSPGTEDEPSRPDSPQPLSRSATPVQRMHAQDIDTSIRENETPETWIARLDRIDRRELAGVLAASADEFHTAALTLYMNRFDFTHIALDVALRRLLMHMSLPRETQQIDRVIEAFATRYDLCEPGLFGTKDNAYVLAFSMMMLHTDAFNRHNKNKMTKPDYVRNTRLDGVPPPVLEAFFDNITFTPFVFIEDDNEAALAAAGAQLSASNGLPRSGKIDVYDLIVGGQLGTLRVDVERYIPADSPFSCMGTRPFLDVDRLQNKFASANPLEFVKSRPRRKSAVLLNMDGGAMMSTPKEEVITLKITKVGLVSRKDDSPSTKRAAARKWRSWSVILTGSQLLFFKDPIWALTLVEQIRNAGKGDTPSIPRLTSFQPDEVLSVKDGVAVFDRDYSATPFTFRFVMPDNRQHLMQFNDEYEMNEWLSLINYASTFKTAGIRMRGNGLNSGDAVKAGSVAAEEHRRDVESGTSYQQPESLRSIAFERPGPSQTETLATPRPRLRRVGSLRASPAPAVDIDISGANDVVVNGGEQMKAVIGSVKAELAAGRAGAARMFSLPSELAAESNNKTKRVEGISARVEALKSDAAKIEQRLTSNLRTARNLAILTPFQKSTRDRIEAALPDLASQIRSDRIELSKLHLWITMLLKDQDRDQRDWARVRHVALQAAARSLCAPSTEKPDRRATIGAPINIPMLSLPHHDESASTWGENVGSASASASGRASPGEFPVTNPMDDDDHDHDHDHDHELEPEQEQEQERSQPERPTLPPARRPPPSSPLPTPPPQYPPPTSPLPAPPRQFPPPQFPRISQKVDVGSAQPSPTCTSDPTSDSEYELAPEYLGSSESLRGEMERQLAFSDDSHTTPVPHRPSLPYSSAPFPDLGANEDGPSQDQPEHWRNTRAATKVSLAHLPRSSIGELSRRFIKIDNEIIMNGD